MSVRLYIGNLPQNVNVKELEALLTSIGDGIKFKAVFDRDTKACRGFGFANIKDENVANELIEKLNGHEFNGNKLRVERSERKDSNSETQEEERVLIMEIKVLIVKMLRKLYIAMRQLKKLQIQDGLENYQN